MAYNAVAQHETHDDGSDASASPAPATGAEFRRISMDFDNLGGRDFMEEIKPNEESGTGRLGSMMRSMASTGTSYDMVEEDDYDDARDSPELQKPQTGTSEHAPQGASPTQQHSSSPEPMIRKASISRALPLRHPTPDLQSLQGAYVGNVERLEKSAERLSLTSNIEEELQRMKWEQRVPSRQSSAPVDSGRPRQFSTSSVANSIAGVNTTARSGGYSPGGYFTSPRGSILSQHSLQGRTTSRTSRLPYLPEPELEGRPLDSPVTPNVPILPPPQIPQTAHFANAQGRQSPSARLERAQDEPDRPPTSASNDTYRQATNLFQDFDGVHYTSHVKAAPSRQPSLNNPLATRPQSYAQPPPGEHTVFYPAPIPVMLNLPQRLSKAPSAGERERRRTHLLSGIPNDARKSAAWLGGVQEEESDGANAMTAARKSTHNLASIPPQLRASAFFDQPAAKQDVEVLQESAVATLDSILDAAAHAPVSAFTDHPIVGHVGKEVYGRTPEPSARRKSGMTVVEKKKRRSSITMLLSRKDSSGVVEPSKSRIASRESTAEEDADQTEADAARASGEGTPLRGDREGDIADESILPGDDEVVEDDRNEAEDEARHGEDEDEYDGPPTTLLAELQMRKQHQKMRNRTAATAFPNGMHSTLLELDAVAQVQEKARKKKHVTLAWEDPTAAEEDGPDDEDVPLGVLFPGKRNEVNRPIGLMEKREIEENEPLSQRRARLRGEPPQKHADAMQRSTTMFNLDVPGLTDSKDGDEGETLAQRIRRLKAQGGTATGLGSGDFTGEVLSQLGGPANEAPKSKTPDAEETLGQRRKRLQAEGKSRDVSGGSGTRPPLQPRHSLADILQAHPAPGARKPSNESRPAAMEQMPYQYAYQNLHPMFANAYNNGLVAGGLPSFPSLGSMPYAAGYDYGSPLVYSPAMMNGFGRAAWANESMMAQSPVIDPKQRDMIDRWRQSVLQ